MIEKFDPEEQFNPWVFLSGITRKSKRAEIHTAYKVSAKKHHPDAGGNAEYFMLVKRAFDILKSAPSRAKYIRAMDGFTDPCMFCSGRGDIVEKIKTTTFRSESVVKVCPECCGAGRNLKKKGGVL